MRRLTDLGKSWINYLFANDDGEHNDIQDFLVRVSLINNSHVQILETMLDDIPNMDLVKECKDEIAFQRFQLEDMMNEFVDFTNLPVDERLSADEILTDLCDAGTNSYLYEIASEWQEWGEKAHRIWDKLNDCYGHGLHYIHNDLCRLIMVEVHGDKEED